HAAIEAHLDAYDLRETVEHESENYFASIEQVMVRQAQGQPVLYYTWTPFWLSSVLVPDEDVVWLTVPGETTATNLVDGQNLGFDINQIEILASPEFLAENPTVARFFEVAKVPIGDVNRQNQRMRNGENTPQDIRHHAETWVADNQGVFDDWLAEARSAR
ncbi:MAG: glycine betaine ABC transporter substrate-binding protein, partial [Cyanobacteria bacterium J06632_22]